MMTRLVAPLPSTSRFLHEPADLPLLLHRPRSSSSAAAAARVGSSRICCASRRYENIPKLEPFDVPMDRFERILRDLPLIQKTQKELADYCTTLEGDPCYSCWMAYFELRDLESEMPKKDLERLIHGEYGLKDLIDCLHSISAMYGKKKELNGISAINSNKENNGSVKALNEEKRPEDFHVPDGLPKSADKENNGSVKALNEEERPEDFHVPDGLPKSAEELEEEEKATMPDSDFTRLLRVIGRSPDHGERRRLFYAP